MKSSSSDELTSDEEIEEIIESVWRKTKLTLKESEIESEKYTKLSSPVSLSKSDALKHDDSQTGEETNESSLFVVDKRPSLVNGMNRPSSSISSDKSKKKKVKEKYEKRDTSNKFQSDKSLKLSSSLQVKWDPSNIYINLHSQHAPQPKHGTPLEQICKETEEIMKKSVVTADFEKRASVPSPEEDARQKQKERKKEREKTKGGGWYNMPKGKITEETKNDLLALKMRRALDPKRFYKGDDIKGMPKYFQFGTVVEDASEFYSARIPKKQRKKTMVEELMADAEFRKFNKRKYAEVQDLKAKGLGPYHGVRTMKTKRKKKK